MLKRQLKKGNPYALAKLTARGLRWDPARGLIHSLSDAEALKRLEDSGFFTRR